MVLSRCRPVRGECVMSMAKVVLTDQREIVLIEWQSIRHVPIISQSPDD